jgi:hypothetical protein
VLKQTECRVRGSCLGFNNTTGHMKIAASEGWDRPQMMFHNSGSFVVIASSLNPATYRTGSDSGVTCRTDVSGRTCTAKCSIAGQPACQLQAVSMAHSKQTHQGHAVVVVKPKPRTAA